ncbi:MAG: phospho-N-acetylmuramoyl-pentapeptide-transferase [Clostridia bacterium]|nr:phospho-N-acetylmuramoyl-pentapeptide-transferase [Clostridia bacterium]
MAGLIITPVLIPFLRKLKFGQSIREEGPAWHQKKSGTPTMGGIAIIVACILASLVVMKVSFSAVGTDMYILAVSAFLFGVVGFIDDFIKVVMKRNLGLSAKAKFLMQLFVSILSTVALLYMGSINGELILPFFKETVNIGLFIVPLIIVVQLSVVNSANLTDGLDGLAASVTLVISIFLTICGALMGKIAVAIFMAALSGALLAFLFFNWNPAKVFMGDTGSLFLGGAVALGSAMLKMPIILIIICGVYLIETLSVIIQVVSFKTTGKRVFKMSPLHHHFEMCGYKEKKIVFMFSGATLILCIIGYLCIMNFC